MLTETEDYSRRHQIKPFAHVPTTTHLAIRFVQILEASSRRLVYHTSSVAELIYTRIYQLFSKSQKLFSFIGTIKAERTPRQVTYLNKHDPI